MGVLDYASRMPHSTVIAVENVDLSERWANHLLSIGARELRDLDTRKRGGRKFSLGGRVIYVVIGFDKLI